MEDAYGKKAVDMAREQLQFKVVQILVRWVLQPAHPAPLPLRRVDSTVPCPMARKHLCKSWNAGSWRVSSAPTEGSHAARTASRTAGRKR